MSDYCPIKSFSPERENSVLQWELKLNTVPVTAAVWDLKHHRLKLNAISYLKFQLL
jgi:hypothetical protein